MAMMGGGGLGQLQHLYIYDVEGNKFHYLIMLQYNTIKKQREKRKFNENFFPFKKHFFCLTLAQDQWWQGRGAG